MSSPSETRLQDSFQFSSQYATGAALEDTASLVQHTGTLSDSLGTISPRAPNTAYQWRQMETRARSASPRLQWSLSPLGISMAQRHAQMAEQKAESVFSGVGLGRGSDASYIVRSGGSYCRGEVCVWRSRVKGC